MRWWTRKTCLLAVPLLNILLDNCWRSSSMLVWLDTLSQSWGERHFYHGYTERRYLPNVYFQWIHKIHVMRKIQVFLNSILIERAEWEKKILPWKLLLSCAIQKTTLLDAWMGEGGGGGGGQLEGIKVRSTNGHWNDVSVMIRWCS